MIALRRPLSAAAAALGLLACADRAEPPAPKAAVAQPPIALAQPEPPRPAPEPVASPAPAPTREEIAEFQKEGPK